MSEIRRKTRKAILYYLNEARHDAGYFLRDVREVCKTESDWNDLDLELQAIITLIENNPGCQIMSLLEIILEYLSLTTERKRKAFLRECVNGMGMDPVLVPHIEACRSVNSVTHIKTIGDKDTYHVWSVVTKLENYEPYISEDQTFPIQLLWDSIQRSS